MIHACRGLTATFIASNAGTIPKSPIRRSNQTGQSDRVHGICNLVHLNKRTEKWPRIPLLWSKQIMLRFQMELWLQQLLGKAPSITPRPTQINQTNTMPQILQMQPTMQKFQMSPAHKMMANTILLASVARGAKILAEESARPQHCTGGLSASGTLASIQLGAPNQKVRPRHFALRTLLLPLLREGVPGFSETLEPGSNRRTLALMLYQTRKCRLSVGWEWGGSGFATSRNDLLI